MGVVMTSKDTLETRNCGKVQVASFLKKAGGLALVGMLLAACNSSGTNTVDDTLNVTPGGAPQMANIPREDEIQDPRAYCPKAVLRAGTETYNVYPKGVSADDEDASSKLRYRATISEIARECNSAGPNINIRVGVRGRYLSGPSGETGSFPMPVRVAVTQGDTVLYSQLHQIQANIPAGERNGSFSYVDNNISIPRPDRENIIIYVGYDEGPYDTE